MKAILSKILSRAGDLAEVEPLIALFLGAALITLFLATGLGIPVSTTHTITGSIIGVGLAKRISAVRWGITVKLFWAWIITIPISALFALGFYHLIKLFR